MAKGKLNYDNEAGISKTLGMEGVSGGFSFTGPGYSLHQREENSSDEGQQHATSYRTSDDVEESQFIDFVINARSKDEDVFDILVRETDMFPVYPEEEFEDYADFVYVPVARISHVHGGRARVDNVMITTSPVEPLFRGWKKEPFETKFNLCQRRSNDFRRAHQYRTIDAVEFFED